MNKPEILSAIKARVKFFNTQVSQSSSDPTCPKSKSPKMSNAQVSQIVKAQVTQSPSHPKLKSPKDQVTQSPSCPDCQKSKLPRLPKVQVATM